MTKLDLVSAFAAFHDDLDVVIYLPDSALAGRHWLDIDGVLATKSVDHGGDRISLVARADGSDQPPAPAGRPDHTAGLLSLTDSLARLVDSVARLTDAVITRVERAS